MWTLLTTLTKSSVTWIYIITVVGFLMYGSWQEAKLDRVKRSMAEWQQRAETAEARVLQAEERMEEVRKLMIEEKMVYDRALAHQGAKQKAVAKAKKNDKAVASWLGDPVPDDVRRVFSGKKRKHKK